VADFLPHPRDEIDGLDRPNGFATMLSARRSGPRGDDKNEERSMAMNFYMTLKGAKQGDIKGDVTQKGREHSIMCHAFEYECESPRDAHSGLPMGKRAHKPIKITKKMDIASPLLFNALVNNENLTTVKLMFWRPNTALLGAQQATGTEEQFYTIELTNANICEVKNEVLDVLNPELQKFPPLEEVKFVFQKITITYMKGGITASDDWETPIA
jgi:type VI secretion system secreted protein Hcp